MDLGTVERVATNEPLARALAAAFSRLRNSGAPRCALAFDPEWRPTMDVVELAANELSECLDIETLVLVHPSSAMTFIASALGLRVPTVTVSAQRSVYDELEDQDTDATASKTMFVMKRDEHIDHFVRRSVRAAQARALRRFALLFDGKCVPTMEIADVLAEELLRSGGVREIGLIHPSASLETLVAALRLRIPTVRIAYASATARAR
jgi:hypothetical protein